MSEEVWVELPRNWSMRVIEVEKLQVGDVVQPNKEPQMVREVKEYDGKQVWLRLSGEDRAKLVTKSFLYKLVKLRGEQ